MTRFDAIIIFKDIKDKENDYKIAEHMSKFGPKEKQEQDEIHIPFLRKYVKFIKTHYPASEYSRPPDLIHKVSEYYSKIRQTSSDGHTAITPRQIDGIWKFITSRAALMQRQKLEDRDYEKSLEIVNFVLRQMGITDPETGEVDVGVIYREPTRKMGDKEVFIEVMNQLTKDGDAVSRDEIVDTLIRVGGRSKFKAEQLFMQAEKGNVIWQPKSGFFKLV